MADDLGWNDLGRFNGGLTITPAIDELISEGILLQRFHTFKGARPRDHHGCNAMHLTDCCLS